MLPSKEFKKKQKKPSKSSSPSAEERELELSVMRKLETSLAQSIEPKEESTDVKDRFATFGKYVGEKLRFLSQTLDEDAIEDTEAQITFALYNARKLYQSRFQAQSQAHVSYGANMYFQPSPDTPASSVNNPVTPKGAEGPRFISL